MYLFIAEATSCIMESPVSMDTNDVELLKTPPKQRGNHHYLMESTCY